jgi:hypothetical protein
MVRPGDQSADSCGDRRATTADDQLRGPLEVELGDFCAEAVDALARGRDADVTVAEAVIAYLDGVGDKPELRVPPGLATFEPTPTHLTVALDLDPADLGRLRAEADGQDVAVERLVEQAVIAAYAELDRDS